MRTVHNYKLQDDYPYILVYQGHAYDISTIGYSDPVAVYYEDEHLYVLTYSIHYGYVSLQEYRISDQAMTRELFVQTDYELAEIIGKNWYDYADITIAKRMQMHLPE